LLLFAGLAQIESEKLKLQMKTTLNPAGFVQSVKTAAEGARMAKVPGLTAEDQRKLIMMRTQISSPVPTTPGAADEYGTRQARIEGLYGKGHGTLNGAPINGSDIEEAMGSNRNPDQLKEMWLSWHDAVGKPMKTDYARLVELSNAGAQELGFADTGALWRSNYDMEPDAFAAPKFRIDNPMHF
jgi:peptidyl-dipeptidase A